MNRIIRLLEKNDFESVKGIILSSKYLPALRALADSGCIRILRAWGDDIVDVNLLDHYATYQLSRQELWKNRIGGYIAGIISGVVISVISAIVIGLLPM